MAVDLNNLEQAYDLPSGLLSAVQNTEDAGADPNATSSAGAVGPFQFMPNTAKAYGVKDPTDYDQAAVGAAKMFADLKDQYGGDIPSMLAAYNWGSGNVDKHGIENAPPETKSYISKIMGAIGDAIAPSAEAAETSPKDPSKMSDEELLTEADRAGLLDSPEGYYGGALHMTIRPQGSGSSKDATLPDPSKMSDEELLNEASKMGLDVSGGTQPPAPPAQTDGYNYNANSYGANVAHDILPELKNDVVGGLDQAGEGFKQFARGLTPSINDQEAGNPLSRLYDVAAGFGKSALGAGGVIGAPIDAAVRAAAANPIQRATGIPAGLTAFVGDVAAPMAATKAISALPALAGASQDANQAGKLSGLYDYVAARQAQPPANAVEEVFGSRSPEPTPPQPNIPMSRGQTTQNPDIQRFEADVTAGSEGSKAQGAATSFRATQNAAMGDRIAALGSVEADANPADSINAAANIIKSKEATASKAVDAAYNQARAMTENVKVDPRDMAHNLVPDIYSVAKEYGVSPTTTPKAYGVQKQLYDTIKSTSPTEKPLSMPIMLDKMELWRRSATRQAQSAADPADRGAIRQMIGKYDNYMTDLAARKTAEYDQIGIRSPEAEGINAFKNAIAERAEYGRRYEGNDVVDSILAGKNGGKTIDDITNDILGAGKPGLKTGMLDNYNSMLRAAGDQAPQVRTQLQNAFAQKIFNFATEKTSNLANSNEKAISPAKLQTALQNVFVRQREFSTALFGSQAVDKANQVIQNLGKITSKQANVGNVSNSGYTLMRAMSDKANLLTKIPGLKWLDGLAAASKDAAAARDAELSFSNQTPKRFQPKPTQNAGKVGAVVAPSEVRHDKRQGY